MDLNRLLHVDIARTGMQIEERTAISHLSLNPVARHGAALNRRRDFEASG